MKTKSLRRPRTHGQYRARLLGQLHGQDVFEWPVLVTHGQDASLWQVHSYPKELFRVVAPTARAARDLVSREFQCEPCIEIDVYGVQAGLAAHHYHGWDSAVFFAMDRAAFNQGQMLLTF